MKYKVKINWWRSVTIEADQVLVTKRKFLILTSTNSGQFSGIKKVISQWQSFKTINPALFFGHTPGEWAEALLLFCILTVVGASPLYFDLIRF